MPEPVTPPATPPVAPPATPIPPVTPPVTPPATPPVTPPATPPAEPHPNDPHKYRRLFEARDTELVTTKAQLTEAQTAAATEKTAREAALRRAIAAEKGLPADAAQFLTAPDEAGLIAQADGLVALRGAQAAPPPPPQGGTITNPPAGQQPSIDEQISAAEKAGNFPLLVSLKRQRAGLS